MFRILLLLAIATCVKAQDRTMGLLFNNEEESYPGYTLFSNSVHTYLIDNCGEAVHSWRSDYRSGHAVHLLENGNLLRAGQVDGDFLAGGRGGVFELYDWEGILLWQYFHADSTEWAHHDIALLPSGNFLFSAWVRHSEAEAKSAGSLADSELWSEKIVEIQINEDFSEKIVWEWDSWDHLIQDVDSSLANYGDISEKPEKIDINYISPDGGGDKNFQHVNALDYNETYDQVVFSSRFLGEIMVIDHQISTEEAKGSAGDILYRYGNPQVYRNGDEEDRKLRGQHNIQWVDDSTFIVFNNLFMPDGQSQVQIFRNPIKDNGDYEFTGGSFGDDSIIWHYKADNFFSNILSSAQLLANRNVLICLGKTGRFLEVNPDKEVVWEYICPVNRNLGPMTQGDPTILNTMFKIRRYAPDFPAFVGRNLIPIGPIERDPLPSVCDVSGFGEVKTAEQQVSIVYDGGSVFIKNEGSPVFYEVYSLSGVRLREGVLQNGLHELSSQGLPPSIYVLKTKYQALKIVFSSK